MDNDLLDYCREVTDYVLGRATDEGSIQTYYDQNFSDKKSLWELINEVITLHIENEDYDQTGKEILSGDAEYAYISGMTGVSPEVAELLVWFNNCYMMKDGCVIWNEACPVCGHGELYEREVEGGAIYESCFECVGCGTKHTFEEMLGDTDEEMPLKQYKAPSPLKGLNPDGLPAFTERDAIYRFRVSRRIVELFGTDTLADLSREIQCMFGLSDERASSFYMGEKFFESGREIVCPRFSPFDDDETSTAENYEIYLLSLYENQKFLYLHDFIRENRFNIRFLGIRTSGMRS